MLQFFYDSSFFIYFRNDVMTFEGKTKGVIYCILFSSYSYRIKIILDMGSIVIGIATYTKTNNFD